MGEQLARMREQQDREAQARSEQAAREQAARMSAERDAARASLAPVHRPEWWDTAQAEDVTKAYTTAKAWSEVEPEAVRAEQRIVKEVRNRFGVDVTRAGEPANVAEAIERAERARADANQQRGGARDDRAEAVGLMAAANATDRAAEAEVRAAEAAADDPELADLIDPQRDPQADVDEARDAAEGEHGRASEMREDAGQSYDSAERREAMAKGFDHIENRAAVDARVTSDVAQGRPATDAVQHAPGRAPKARKTRSGPGTGRKVQRPAQGR
jgi:hypothetical protein